MYVAPSVVLLNVSWGEADIARMADVVYRYASPDHGVDAATVERRVRAFLDAGHWSVLEFIDVTFLVECSRACTHQIVRHRMASYWQESQRYVRYGKVPLRICAPPGVREAVEVEAYWELLDSGARPEDARYALPNAACARLLVKMNLREIIFSFLALRTGLGAQHEVRLIAWELYRQLKPRLPIAAAWAWDRLPSLHPDYCRNADKAAERHAGHGHPTDCRSLSIWDAYEAWGLRPPGDLAEMIYSSAAERNGGEA